MAASTLAVPRRIPSAVLVGIGLAWLVASGVQLGGISGLLDHDVLGTAEVPLWAAVVLFAVGWQLMIAAMMLPSSVPMVRLFAAISSDQPRRATVLGAFVGGYAVVWAVFGLLAFAGDAVLHQLVERVPWLDARPWLVAAGALAVAGTFQLSGAKDRCLDECRQPGAFLLPRYRRGIAEAFRIGRAHGRSCLGCCWALMLVLLAAGVADLRWMAGLGALMAYEKIGRHGPAVARVAGVLLVAWAALVAVQPSWLPSSVAGLA